MTIKLLHLNIFQGKFLPQVIEYIKTHDFDILHFQEVSGGSFSKGGTWSGEREKLTTPNPQTIGIDCFQTIKDVLSYEGILLPLTAKRHDASSYFGNATFFKPSLKLIEAKHVYLKPYMDTGDTPIPAQDMPRAAISAVFSLHKKNVAFINAHLAWGPTSRDKPYKIEQGKILYEYVQSLTSPFVLTGDFNVEKSSQIVTWMQEVGKNLVVQHHITNTLNPRVHAAKHLFPPGLGVDFAFTSPLLTVSDFHLVDTPDLSDHFGFSLTLEF